MLGVPLGAFVGSALGWRWAFGLLAALCALTAVLESTMLPVLPSVRTFGLRDLVAPVRSRRLRDILVITATVVIGNYAAYTYVTPLLHGHGVDDRLVGPFLLCYGVAGVAGNFAAGAVMSRTDQHRPVMIGLITACSATLLALVVPGSPASLAALLVVWGAAYSALPVVLQTRILRTAAAGTSEATTAIYVLVFNCSIATGALVGGLAFDAGGAGGPILTGALCCAVGAVVIAVRRTASDAT